MENLRNKINTANRVIDNCTLAKTMRFDIKNFNMCWNFNCVILIEYTCICVFVLLVKRY